MAAAQVDSNLVAKGKAFCDKIRIPAEAVGELAHQRQGEESSPQANTLAPLIQPNYQDFDFSFYLETLPIL